MIRRTLTNALAVLFLATVTAALVLPIALMTYVTWRDEVVHTSTCGWQR